MQNSEARVKLIKALANFIAGDQVAKGMTLHRSGVTPDWGNDWIQVRSAIPGISGYPTVESAEKILATFLGVLLDPKPVQKDNLSAVLSLFNSLTDFNFSNKTVEVNSKQFDDPSLDIIRVQVDQLRQTISQALAVAIY